MKAVQAVPRASSKSGGNFGRHRKSVGLEWKEVDCAKLPSEQHRVENAKLQEALEAGTLSFTQEEWDEIGVENCYPHSYVKLGDNAFFMPVVAHSKRRAKNEPTLGVYQIKLLKQVHPDIGISSAAVATANHMVEQIAAVLLRRSARIAVIAKKTTLSSKHVQAATNLTLPCELGRLAVSEATRATIKFVGA